MGWGGHGAGDEAVLAERDGRHGVARLLAREGVDDGARGEDGAAQQPGTHVRRLADPLHSPSPLIL